MSNQVIERKPNGQFEKGSSGNLGGNAQRSRHALNADTIREMHAAFRQGGREAIDKVMRTQPAVFLKLLVLLVPREMKVEHGGGVKAMTDEQLEAAVDAIKAMLAAREAKVIEGTAETVALPAPDVVPDDKAKRPNEVMDAADTVGARERKPRKRVTIAIGRLIPGMDGSVAPVERVATAGLQTTSAPALPGRQEPRRNEDKARYAAPCGLRGIRKTRSTATT